MDFTNGSMATNTETEIVTRRLFCKKDVFKNFVKCTGKYLLVTAKFCEIFKSTYFVEYLRMAASTEIEF